MLNRLLHLIGFAILFVVVVYVPPLVTGLILIFGVTVYAKVLMIMRDLSRRPIIYEPDDSIDSAM